MASIIIEEAFDLAKHVGMNRYKIASRTVVDNPELCQRIIAEGKEVFCSLGFWQQKEFPFGPPTNKLRYIFCRSSYPAYPEELAGFPTKFSGESYYGYSDHCHGISACLLAVSRGAKFIEKHFTLNKTSQVIRDHVLSSDPEEFAELTRLGTEIAKLYSSISD